MKLASLNDGLDGRLILVSRDLTQFLPVDDIAPTMQYALDHWDDVSKLLNDLSAELNSRQLSGALALDTEKLAAPLPRAYEFLDGSAYLPHVERVRRARGAEVPDTFYEDPLMYQATSAGFLGPQAPVVAVSEEHGIDFEAEVIVVTGAVPMAAGEEQAGAAIVLIGLVNDVSLRNLIPPELAKGFGFVQSKPRSALSPVLCTPDELEPFWRDYVLHRPLHSKLNGEWFGSPDAGTDMQFNFAKLVAHAARTRPLAPGTIIGSGTIANQDTSVGASCLAELRMLEIIDSGAAKTPFMSFGDRIRIEMLDDDGNSLFGAIDQRIEPLNPGS